MKHKNLSPTEKALLTWYAPDNSKYKDPLHPTLKLAGEIGELLDLYAKHLFKPNFDWWNCKWCNTEKLKHVHLAWDVYTCQDVESNKFYTPKVLDELGDIWFYLRILFWICYDLQSPNFKVDRNRNILDCIKKMYYSASILLTTEKWCIMPLYDIYEHLAILLNNLDCSFEELTELNYQKLNSEETNHGWKDAK